MAYTSSTKGVFTNHVDKTMVVGGTGNANGMQISPYNSKGIPSHMSTVGTLSLLRGPKSWRDARPNFFTLGGTLN